MDPGKPKMTVDLALAALKARPQHDRPRTARPPAEHPWKFSDESFNRMLDKGDDEFLNKILFLIGMMIPVLHHFRGKPYSKDDIWQAAHVAAEKNYGSSVDYLSDSEKHLFYLMVDDVMAGTYRKSDD